MCIACSTVLCSGRVFAQPLPQPCVTPAAACNANVAGTYLIVPLTSAFGCPENAPCDIANPPCAHTFNTCPPVSVSTTHAHTSCQWCVEGIEPNYGVRLLGGVEWQLLIRTSCYGCCSNFDYRNDPATGTGVYWFGCKVQPLAPVLTDDPSGLYEKDGGCATGPTHYKVI